MMHRQLETAAERYDFSQEENVARFTRLLRKYKVEQLLEAAGACPGDSVSIGYKDFDFYPDYYPEELPEDEPEELPDGGEDELLASQDPSAEEAGDDVENDNEDQ